MQKQKHIASCECKPATHAWCVTCQDTRELRTVTIRPGQTGYRAGYRGAGLLCTGCHNVLVTLYRVREGGSGPSRRLTLVTRPGGV